jgi:hypothetical protein
MRIGVRSLYGSNTPRAPFHAENLQGGGLSCSVVIRSTSSNVRQIMLSLVALVAILHANLTADLTGRAPNAAGITQLGRDILRISFGEVVEHRLVKKRRRDTIDA